MSPMTIELDPAGKWQSNCDGLRPCDGPPDDWAAYWPTDTYEGPYDDYANPIPGAESPFRFNASAQNNSTNLDSGVFKSAFLAWPFEWIDTVDERAEILGAALGWMCAPPAAGQFYLTPPGQDGSAVAGESIAYTLTIINSLGYDESFDISYASVWPTSGPASVAVPDGDSVDFVVTVTTPADGNCYATDTALVTATAASDPTDFKTANLNSSIDPSGLGGVGGTISDANTGLGIENAYLYMELGTAWFETYTDPNGLYSIPNVPACNYTGTANAYGYFDVYGLAIDITVGAPITVNVALDASLPVLTGAPVNMVMPPDSAGNYYMNLANQGTGDLYFHISEVPAGTYPLPLYTDPAMPTGIDPQVLANIDAAPNGTSKFIVYMRQQADLSAAYDMDWSARGQYVLDTLRAVANQTQASLVKDLNKQGVDYETRYIVNALVVSGDISLVNTLASRPEVGYIGPNTAVPAPAPVAIDTTAASTEAIEWNISKVAADQVWLTYGVTGDGIVLSNMDTGVQWDHPALINQYRGWDGMAANHNFNWWDPYNQNPLEPTDADSHGTHTMGTMLGDDGGANQIGVAPGAQWLACDGFNNDTGYGYDAELLECAEFLLAPWDLSGANPDPAMRPDIINNSWGGGQGVWWYNQAIYAWRAAGIMGIFSAGNEGSNCSTAGSPGDSANMLAVGATDINDNIAGFSSRGPAAVTGILKPNVSAPGVNIRSSVPGSGYAGGWNGTSMAAPHVAGTVALIWSAVPELRGDVQLTSWIIEQNADGKLQNQGCGGDLPTDIPNNVFGWGRINAFNAVSAALDTVWDIPWLDVNPVSGTAAPGEIPNINLSFDTTGLTEGVCYTGTLKFEYNDPFIVEEFVPVEVCVGTPNMEVSTDLLEMTLLPDETGVLTFTISNIGTAPLQWNFSEGVDWLTEDPLSGTIPPDGFTEVAVTFDSTGMAPGQYPTQLYIVSNDNDWPFGFTVNVILTVEVPPAPDIAVAPLLLEKTLVVGETGTLSFTISNVGALPLTWDLADNAAWLSALPASGTIAPAGSTEVVATFDAAGLAQDVYTATISVNSNDPDEAVVMVDVVLTVIPVPVPDIEVTAPPLEMTLIPGGTGTLSFSIGNVGTAALDWTLADGADWLSALLHPAPSHLTVQLR
jgi:subtilisin family serine protease